MALLCSTLFTALSSPPAVLAQTDHCDPDLPPAATNPLAYRLRGDRCEGIYIQDVASTVLRLVSFTQAFEDFDPSVNRPLVLEWTPLADGDTRIRAQSLRSRLYYRMDSHRPAGSMRYEWPVDVLATLGVRRNDVGILAWKVQKIGEITRQVYLPLRIRQRTAPQPGLYRLSVIPGVECEDVFISLAPVGTTGESGAYVFEKWRLDLGYYPAGRAIVFTLPALKGSNFYRLDIGATLTSGGASAMTVFFYHAL